MANLDAKKSIVEEIKEKLDKAESIVLSNGRGLTVAQDTALRKDLRENDVDYKVYKNTLVNLAIEGTEYEELAEFLAGPTTVAFSYEDPLAPARVIAKHQKEADALEFKAGVIGGEVYDADGIIKFASIPPQEELYAKLLGSFNAPLGSFVRLIKAYADDLEENGEGTEEVAEEVEEVEEAEAAETEEEETEEAEATEEE